ncbi:hypothetical protein JCM10207_006144 [Rhodosporidiobolus poonsookiae]
MHTAPGSPQPTSPYANLSVPYFDRRESVELSSLAQREFEALTSGPSAAGIALKTRESDKAYVEKMTGKAATASKTST